MQVIAASPVRGAVGTPRPTTTTKVGLGVLTEPRIVIRIFFIRICFGFRISTFELPFTHFLALPANYRATHNTSPATPTIIHSPELRQGSSPTNAMANASPVIRWPAARQQRLQEFRFRAQAQAMRCVHREPDFAMNRD